MHNSLSLESKTACIYCYNLSNEPKTAYIYCDNLSPESKTICIYCNDLSNEPKTTASIVTTFRTSRTSLLEVREPCRVHERLLPPIQTLTDKKTFSMKYYPDEVAGNG